MFSLNPPPVVVGSSLEDRDQGVHIEADLENITNIKSRRSKFIVSVHLRVMFPFVLAGYQSPGPGGVIGQGHVRVVVRAGHSVIFSILNIFNIESQCAATVKRTRGHLLIGTLILRKLFLLVTLLMLLLLLFL